MVWGNVALAGPCMLPQAVVHFPELPLIGAHVFGAQGPGWLAGWSFEPSRVWP